jgi:GH24 family phage-related lysozyme (muramidase)
MLGLFFAMDQAFVLARLERFEGRIPHMYRCTGGEVTIGIGHAILSPEDATKLGWMVDGRAATPDEVRAGYARVASAEMGLVASRYAPLSACRMPDIAIDALAASDVDAFSSQIAAHVPGFSAYPDCVQAALFDMAFNLGIGGLLKFHKLLAACDAGDWNTAAAECHRQGIGDDRNQETADLFRQALTKT